MTAVSLGINNGVDGFKNSDITVGTNAPSGVDFEFRFNLTDANSHNVTVKELLIALKAFVRAVETGGGNIKFTAVGGPP